MVVCSIGQCNGDGLSLRDERRVHSVASGGEAIADDPAALRRDELREIGYTGLDMAKVARRAGTNKNAL